MKEHVQNRIGWARALVICLGLMALLMLLLTVVFYDKPIGPDFLLRYNELTAVSDGIDPYLIWSGQVRDERFYPYNHLELRTGEEQSPIHAYTPWSYAYTLPFFLSFTKSGVWKVFQFVQVLSVLLIGFYGFWRCFKVRGFMQDGVFGAAMSLSLGMTYAVAYALGNYSILIAAVFVLMIICLNRNADVLAGVCWALAMTKPQFALLVAIPLVLKRKWKTIVTALVICTSASMIPAVMCDRSPIEMILQVRKLGAGYYNGGTALIPGVVVDAIFGAGDIEGKVFLLPINAIVGITIVLATSWVVRKSQDWLVLISPALLFSSTWTYLSALDRTAFSIPAIGLAVWCVRKHCRAANGFSVIVSGVFTICGLIHLVNCDGILQKIFSLFSAEYPSAMVHNWLTRIDTIAMFAFVLMSFAVIILCRRRVDGRNEFVLNNGV